MGLAASQAKLLSLTCRISDNELRAQSLTAAKMALANQTSEASREYLKALNTSEFVYRTYDDNGDKVYTKLTGAQLSTYAPLKNQYALINPQGQILVSELDAANYEDSANINEFLEKYGIDKIETGQTRTVRNPAYDVAYEDWKKKYDEWMKRKPDEKIRTLITPAYDEEISDKDNELYQRFLTISAPCRNVALSGPSGSGCYEHVLLHLLYLHCVEDGVVSSRAFDFSKYPVKLTTTTGDPVEVSPSYGLVSNIEAAGNTPKMQEISDAVCYGYKGKTLMATKDSIFVSIYDLTEDDIEGNMTDPNYKKKRLLSNYTIDSNGNIVLKTLVQKCTDMFYLITDFENNYYPYYLHQEYYEELKTLIYSFC